MPKIYFGGGEVKHYRDLVGSDYRMAFSFYNATAKNPNVPPLEDLFPLTNYLLLDSGSYSARDMSATEASMFNDRYMEFASQNPTELTLEFAPEVFNYDSIKDIRAQFWEDTFDLNKVAYIWQPRTGISELERMLEYYDVVALTQDAFSTVEVMRVNQLASRFGTHLHGLGITQTQLVKSVHWSSISTSSWISPSKYGSYVAWNGTELKQFPKDYRSNGIQQSLLFLGTHGFDPQKLIAADNTELLRVSMWSWQQFADSLVTRPQNRLTSTNAETAPSQVDNLPTQVRNESQQRETVTLPGLVHKTENNVRVLTTRSESSRVCNTCFLSQNCPAFQENANCAFNLPLEIRTKDQLKALDDSMIEMQAARVYFLQFSEQTMGLPSETLSIEIDRLNKMIDNKAKREREGFSLSVNVSGNQESTGVLSKLFGNTAGQRARELENGPVSADQVILANNLVDAELVENGE